MSRKERLSQLKTLLSERRKELLKMLNGRNKKGVSSPRLRTGDAGDASLYNTNSEMSTRIAAMESDELKQIDIALKKFKENAYGICEISGKMIPLARLQALPFTRYSVEAQREQEARGVDLSNSDAMDWESAILQENRTLDKEVNLRELPSDE